MKRIQERFLTWLADFTKTDIRYVLRNGSWIVLGRIGLFLGSFALTLAFSHLVSKETYGTYQYIISVIGVVSIISLPGIDIALVRSIAQKKEGSYRHATAVRLRWSLLGSCVLGLFALWYGIHHNTVLALSFLVAGLFFPFMQALDAFEYFWNGRKNFQKSMLHTGLSFLIPAGITTAVLFFTDNLIIIIASFVMGYTLVRIFFTWYAYRHIANNERDGEMVSLGKTLTLVQGIDIAVTYVDKLFLWFFVGPVAVAIYSFAQMPVTKAQLLTPIQMLALPKLSEGEEGFPNKHLILKKFYKLFLFTTPLTIGLMLIAPPLFRIFFPQYPESIPYLRVLLSVIALMPFTLLNTSLISTLQKKEVSWIQLIMLGTRCLLFFLLIPPFGIWGAVGTVLVTEIERALLTLFFFLRIPEKETHVPQSV